MVLSFEETPLFDWFKKNRISIFLMLAIVFGGNAYFYYAPGLAHRQNADSWALYQTISAEIDLKENLSAKLTQAEQDTLTYPWFVYAATRMALQANDSQALDILKPRLSEIASSKEGMSWVASNNGETRPIASILLDAANDNGGSSMEFSNEAPDGDVYIMSVTDGIENTYELSISLYSAAPQTSEHFVANLEGLVGAEIKNFANISLAVENGLEEEAPAITIERNRLFHSEGVLCTVASGDGDGSQRANTVQIMLRDNFFADGQSTVFGAITSGLDEIKEAAAGLGNDHKLTVVSINKG
ncbi:MAG: hypothetical protein ACI84O_001348 [Myxococcota bacterium]|jgi:hypothetical protein